MGQGGITLNPRDTAPFFIGLVHYFADKSDTPLKVLVVLGPASEEYETSICILYGLAADDKCNKEGLPKNIVHLALCQ